MTGETKFEGVASIGQAHSHVQDVPAAGAHGTDAGERNDAEKLRQDNGERGAIAKGEVAVAPEIALPAVEAMPDFEPSAADCMNRALRVALSLGHASFSSDHLMLALTMDQHARKLLQRLADVGLLREAAMIRLGKMHWKFARRPDQPHLLPSATSDLDEIHKAARNSAAERDQRIAVNDLVNAFPTKDGRIVYGLKETTDSVPAILERIESKLVPRVSDFLARFELQIRESVEQKLEAALKDFGETQLKEIVERQLGAAIGNFEERQLKELAERQRTALDEIGEDFKERHLAALEQLGNALQTRQFEALEAMEKQVQHDLDTLATVLKHFRDRLNRQEPG